MKLYAIGAILLPFVLVSLVPAAPRVMRSTPGQSRNVTQAEPTFRRINVNIATVAQINPAYTSAYVPDGYDSATQSDILAEIRQLRGRVDIAAAAAQNAAAIAASRSPGAPPGPVVPPVAPPYAPPTPPAGRPKVEVGGAIGLAVLNAKCASCHQAGKLAPDQRFTLLDMKGNLATLTDKQKLRVMTKTYSQQMPPPSNIYNITPLLDSEYAAIVDLIQ